MPETCSSCGSSVQPASNYCVHCGKSLEATDAPRVEEPEFPEEPRSWREWCSSSITSLGGLLRDRGMWTRPWTREDWKALAAWNRSFLRSRPSWRWTWKRWVALAAIVWVVLLLLIAYVGASPSFSCRERVERQMIGQIKSRLSDPGAMRGIDGPSFMEITSNEYMIELEYEYPNRSGGMDERTALGSLRYIRGETCEFRLVNAGE